MIPEGARASTEPPALGAVRLEDLVDREALGELAESLHALFGLSVRFFSSDGALLADRVTEQALCHHLQSVPGARAQCARTIDHVKRLVPDGAGSAAHPCFTGAEYLVVNVTYEQRRMGRAVLGPYLSPEIADPPPSLLLVDDQLDPADASRLLPAMPRLSRERAELIAAHVQSALDLILFSGHKAWLTSQMHLASVTESYRTLEDKNRRLADAVDRLRELDRLKSNFLATVSHELRTPLTSIIGYSEMLTEGMAGDLSAEQREYVGTIREKGEQLLSLIKSLLDLSKLESGTMALRKATLDVATVTEQVVSTLLPTARKRGVHLESSVPRGLARLHADGEKLRQVFLNLTENALKFTPSGGTVALSAALETSDAEDEGVGFVLGAEADERLVVRVADTGIGIPEAERARVFDAFYQVDSSSTREYGGTGLGLSIVKRLVEAHDGTIRIEGNAPTGAVFVVSLPTAPPSSSS